MYALNLSSNNVSLLNVVQGLAIVVGMWKFYGKSHYICKNYTEINHAWLVSTVLGAL